MIDQWITDPFGSLWTWLYNAAPYILSIMLIILAIAIPILGFLSRKPLMWNDEHED